MSSETRSVVKQFKHQSVIQTTTFGPENRKKSCPHFTVQEECWENKVVDILLQAPKQLNIIHLVKIIIAKDKQQIDAISLYHLFHHALTQKGLDNNDAQSLKLSHEKSLSKLDGNVSQKNICMCKLSRMCTPPYSFYLQLDGGRQWTCTEYVACIVSILSKIC